MVFRVRSVLGPHQRYSREVHARAAILPFITSAQQKIVSDTVGIVIIDNVPCDRVRQSVPQARPKEGIGAIVPYASNDISSDSSALHLVHVLAQIGNRTDGLGHKHDPVGVSSLR